MRLELGNLQLFGFDFRRAWNWWKTGLQAAFSPWAAEIFCRPSPTIRIDWNGSEFRFFRVLRETTRHFATLTNAELELSAGGALREAILADNWKENLTQVELYLPSHLVMFRVLDLPAKDPVSLRQMLSFQLARLTPFSADKLYFDAAVAHHDAERNQGSVHVAAVPREKVDPVLLQLESATGMCVSSLGYESTDTDRSFNLFGSRRVPTRWWRRLNMNSFLLVALLAALFLAAVAPVYQKREQVLDRKADIERIYATASATMQTRNALEDQLQTLNFLLISRPEHTVPEVLSELSDVVPDDIFLSNLRIQSGNVTFSGLGTGVVDLIDTLNESSMFEGARLTSSVTRNPRTGQDQFTAALTLSSKGSE